MAARPATVPTNHKGILPVVSELDIEMIQKFLKVKLFQNMFICILVYLLFVDSSN